MIEMKPLVIGDLTVEKPVIQGGMGVGISLHRLAGAVAKAGGVGLISAAQIGFTEPDFAENPEEANARAIHKELKLAREIAPKGVIGFNIMVATKHYDRWVKEAVKAGADIIVSGAGLPVSLPEYVKEAGEYAPGSFLSSAFSNRLFGPTNEDILWEHQYKVITELAQKGPCVIVGRCADYILQDKADCLKVFIHADMDFRARRIVEVYGEREQSPEERLRDKDKRRAAYHRFYTDMKWGYAQNYHLTLNSGVLGIDQCVKIIASLY